jgi:hypothetical protein
MQSLIWNESFFFQLVLLFIISLNLICQLGFVALGDEGTKYLRLIISVFSFPTKDNQKLVQQKKQNLFVVESDN